VPVRTEGEVGGVLFAGRRALALRSAPTDVLLLLVIADRVGSALVHQRLLERHGEHLAHLREVRALVRRAAPGRERTTSWPGGRGGVPVPGVRAALAIAGSAPAAITGAGAGRLRSVGPEQIQPTTSCSRRVSRRAPVAIAICRRGRRAAGGARARRAPGRAPGAAPQPRACARSAGPGRRRAAEFSTEEWRWPSRSPRSLRSRSTRGAGSRTCARPWREPARQTAQAEGDQARALTAFGAGLTRELSAVFALLLGQVQLMLARAPDESLREGLAALEEAAWRGTDVMQRLLGLAEADRGTELSCDLGAIAQEPRLRPPRPGPGAAQAGGASR